MLRQIRYHRMRGARKQYYGCIGTTLLKPKKLLPGTLDIREEHFLFLQGKKPVSTTEKLIHALLVHENTHSERQCQTWIALYQMRYILSRKFRLDEEKIAYREQIRLLVRYNFRVRVTRMAEAMAGPAYRRMIEYDEARNWVSDMVHEAEIEFLHDLMEAAEPVDDITEPIYANLEASSAMDYVKDRMALVLFAFIGFLIMFLPMFAVAMAVSMLWPHK